MFLGHDNDAMSNAREVHTVIFENDSIRVLNIRLPSGYKTAQHWHPRSMCYVLSGSKMRYTNVDGTTGEIEITPGQVIDRPETEHTAENSGFGEVKLLLIEFKNEK
jgi:hypothetical protein